MQAFSCVVSLCRPVWLTSIAMLCFTSLAQGQTEVRISRPSITILSVKPPGANTDVQTYGVTREDYGRITELLPTAEAIVPVREVQREARYADHETDCSLVGTTPDFFRVRPLSAERGRLLIAKDVAQLNNVAVLGATVAARLFGRARDVGNNVRIDRTFHLVVGVLQRTGDATVDRAVFIPVSTMRSRMGDLEIRRTSGSFQTEQFELSRLEVAVNRQLELPAAATVVRNVMERYHSERDFEVRVSP